jgi:hypothetical protein
VVKGKGICPFHFGLDSGFFEVELDLSGFVLEGEKG